VSVVLSGMTAMDQVEENLAIVDRSRVGMQTAKDAELVTHVAEVYKSLRPVPCTQCNYCMPCPSGVDIPRNLDLYNNMVMYNWPHTARGSYMFMKESARASSCTACLQCEEKCPQQIVVHEWMTCLDGEMTVKKR
jgi:predicted aldo/keto reductase-like oxidoreductase